MQNPTGWSPLSAMNNPNSPSARLRAARAMPAWMNASRHGPPPPPPPQVDHAVEPEYEVIDFGNNGQIYSNAPPLSKGHGRRCDLCGSSAPAVRCVQCTQNFCLSCDHMYHRHPKRQAHTRKELHDSRHLPPLPPKGEAIPAPVPPPRRNRTGRPPPARPAAPPLQRDQEVKSPAFLNSLKRSMPNRMGTNQIPTNVDRQPPPTPPLPRHLVINDHLDTHEPFVDVAASEWDMNRRMRTGSFSNLSPPGFFSPLLQAQSMAQLNGACPTCPFHGPSPPSPWHHHTDQWGTWGPTSNWQNKNSGNLQENRRRGSRRSSMRHRRESSSGSEEEEDERMSRRGRSRRGNASPTPSRRNRGPPSEYDSEENDDRHWDNKKRGSLSRRASLMDVNRSSHRHDDDSMSLSGRRSSHSKMYSGHKDRRFEDDPSKNTIDKISYESDKHQIPKNHPSTYSEDSPSSADEFTKRRTEGLKSDERIKESQEKCFYEEERRRFKSMEREEIDNPNDFEAEAKSESQWDPVPDFEWECQHCTFVNNPGTRVCDVCCKTNTKPKKQGETSPSVKVNTLNRNEHRGLKNIDKTKTERDSTDIRRGQRHKIDCARKSVERIKEESQMKSETLEIQTSGMLPNSSKRAQELNPISDSRLIDVRTPDTKASDSSSHSSKLVTSKGTSPPPQNISTQTHDVPVPKLKRATSFAEYSEWKAPQRTYSRQSLLSDTQSLPVTPPKGRSPERFPELTTLDSKRETEQLNTRRRAGSQPPEYISTLVQKQVKQGLEMVKLLREAEEHKFSADDLAVALLHCEDGDPISWLQHNWKNMIDTVVTLATNYGHERKENTVGTISASEAREALRCHDGNVWAAVTECVEQRQKKYAELLSRGNFSREDIVTVLTTNHGNLEAAYTELSKSQLKPFLMKIWGPPQGVDNESGHFTKLAHDESQGLERGGVEEVSFNNYDRERIQKWLDNTVTRTKFTRSMSQSNLTAHNKTMERLEVLSNLSKTEMKELRARRTSDVHRYLTQFYSLNDNSLKLSKQFRSELNVSQPRKSIDSPLWKFLEKNLGLNSLASSGYLQTSISTTSSNVQGKSVTDAESDSPLMVSNVTEPIKNDSDKSKVLNSAGINRYDVDGNWENDKNGLSPVQRIFVKSITISSEDSQKSSKSQMEDEDQEETSSDGDSFESVNEDVQQVEDLTLYSNLNENSDTKDVTLQGKLTLEAISAIATNYEQNKVEAVVQKTISNVTPSQHINYEIAKKPLLLETINNFGTTNLNDTHFIKNLNLKEEIHKDSITPLEDYKDDGEEYKFEVPQEITNDVVTNDNQQSDLLENAVSYVGNTMEQDKENFAQKLDLSENERIQQVEEIVEPPIQFSGTINESQLGEIISSEIYIKREDDQTNLLEPLNEIILIDHIDGSQVVDYAGSEESDSDTEGDEQETPINENEAQLSETTEQSVNPELGGGQRVQTVENLVEKEIDSQESEVFEEPPETMVGIKTIDSEGNFVSNSSVIKPIPSDVKSELSHRNVSDPAINVVEADDKNLAAQIILNSEGNSERDVSPIPTDSEKETMNPGNEERLQANITGKEDIYREKSPLARSNGNHELVALLKESLTKDEVVERIVSTLFQSVLRANEFKIPGNSEEIPIRNGSRRSSSLSKDDSYGDSDDFVRINSNAYLPVAGLKGGPSERRNRRYFRKRGDRMANKRSINRRMSELKLSTSAENTDGRDETEASISLEEPTDDDDIEREVRRLLAEGQVQTYEQAQLAAELKTLHFNEVDSVLAAKECTTVDAALTFLQQECDLCAGKYCMKQMVSMLECEHICCKECAHNYFTLQISERSVDDCVCPFCKEPDVTKLQDDTASDYFAHLDIFLKALVDDNVHELFQRKLRDRTLMSDPNFKWCIKCSSGFIANPRQKRLVCPDCKTTTCANCRRLWEKEHEKMTCEEFAAFKYESEHDNQIEKHLAEGGVSCPQCHQRYLLAKGGCMHLTCPHCKHEFCSGCSKPFLMGAKCEVSPNCERLGLHSHHPRNCLFYLRDKEPPQLEQLLRDNGVQFGNELDPTSSRCNVQLLKETPDGLVEGFCEYPVEGAGLCRTHYIEWLVELVKANKIDPAGAMDAGEALQELRRHGKTLPCRADFASDNEFLAGCRKIIQEHIPLE